MGEIRGAAIAFGILSCALNGCNMSESHSMPESSAVESSSPNVGSGEHEHYKHNVEKVSKGPWVLEAWTDGSIYSSASAISVGLRLTGDKVPLDENMRPSMEIVLESRSKRVNVVTKNYELRLWKKERESSRPIFVNRFGKVGLEKYFLQPGQGLEAEIWDAFETRRKNTIVPDGDYLIRIRLIATDETNLEIEGLPIQVRSRIKR